MNRIDDFLLFTVQTVRDFTSVDIVALVEGYAAERKLTFGERRDLVGLLQERGLEVNIGPKPADGVPASPPPAPAVSATPVEPSAS